MKPLVLASFPRSRTASHDGESTIIESVYDDESYIEEIVEYDEETIEEVVEDSDSDEETGTFDDQSSVPYEGGNDSSSVAFEDDSSGVLSSKLEHTIQDEMNQSAVFEGTRKAMEEELERDKSRARQAGLDALRQRRLQQETERLAEEDEEDEEDASHVEETEEERRKRQEEALLKQKEQDEDAHKRLAEEIKRVDVALSKKRDTLAYTKLHSPEHAEKRKKALAELRRQAARQELARNNDALKATRASRGGPPSPIGPDPRYVKPAASPENADSVDIFVRTPAPLSPLQFGGSLTPATASKLEFGNVTSPYTNENESETIEEENAPQSLMKNKKTEEETSSESSEVPEDTGKNVEAEPAIDTEDVGNTTCQALGLEEENAPQSLMKNKKTEEETSSESSEVPEDTGKNVEAEPAINTEDVGNTTCQALGLEKKAVDETEELPSEQEANSMADPAQDDGSTGNSNTESQAGLQNGVETPVPVTPTSDSASKLVPPKSTSSVLPKAVDQAPMSSSEECMARNMTSPYSRMETPENESETIEEESVPQVLMSNKKTEEETSIEAPAATAKNVEAEPAINTEDVGNTTDHALGSEKKAVDEAEELPSEEEANNMAADAAQDYGSTGSSNTESQAGLQNGVETPVPVAPTSDSASKLVLPKSTSSVLPKAADQASMSSSEEHTVRRLLPEAPSDMEKTPITTPKKRFSAPTKTTDTSSLIYPFSLTPGTTPKKRFSAPIKTTDASLMSPFSEAVKRLMISDTINAPSPNDILSIAWDGKYHSMEDLRQSNIPGLDNARREKYLSPEDFQEYFKVTNEEFAKFPKWKQTKAKRSLGLF